jgi:hypothetical protein
VKNRFVLYLSAALAMILLAPQLGLAKRAIFTCNILVENARTGRPVDYAAVQTRRGGLVGLMNKGQTNRRGRVHFRTDFGPFAPRGSGFVPEVGTEGLQVDITVTRPGYRPYRGKGFFYVISRHRQSQPTIIRLQPLGRQGRHRVHRERHRYQASSRSDGRYGRMDVVGPESSENVFVVANATYREALVDAYCPNMPSRTLARVLPGRSSKISLPDRACRVRIEPVDSYKFPDIKIRLVGHVRRGQIIRYDGRRIH